MVVTPDRRNDVPASPLDWLTLAYLAFAALVTAARWPSAERMPWGLPLGYAALALVALWAPRLRARGRTGAFLGDFYPLLAAAGLYTAIGVLNRAAGLSHDAAVQAWEQRLFGAQPAYAWIRAQPSAWLSWPLHLGYLAYYPILVAAPLAPWLTGRRPAALRTLFLMMASFYSCYAVFLVFPVAGPHYVLPLPPNAAKAVLPARLIEHVLERGSAWGTAFPSSHVVVALVAAVATWRFWRALGAVLMAAAVLLSFGTVYGQFHYAVDALAGAFLAAVVLLASRTRRPGGRLG